MPVRCSRPAVDSLRYTAFARSVHPELFTPIASRTLSLGEFQVELHLTADGHVISYRRGKVCVTEVLAGSDLLLPRYHRLIQERLRGSQQFSRDVPVDRAADRGLICHGSIMLERLEPNVYVRMEQEAMLDARRATLADIYMSSDGGTHDAVSLLTVECLPHTVVARTVHTFPDERAILTTQCLLELESAAS